MFNFQRGMVTAVLGLALAAGLTGCPKKPAETASKSIPTVKEEAPVPVPPPVETAPPAEQPKVTEKEIVKPPEVTPKPEEGLKDAFFDFDKSTIGPDMKGILDADASWLKANSNVKIKIEGHCDERGTNEYNLALGERRAHAVKQFLISEGISAARLSTISYGEDRPFCTEHNESCYKLNRRAHFVEVH